MIIIKLINFGIILHRIIGKGGILFCSTLSALIITNSRYFDIYNAVLHEYFTISFGNYTLKFSIGCLINEFLMALFFLVVSTEIKRELIIGHLRNSGQRLLPIVAAISGMFIPILIYLIFNYDDYIKIQGWAVPSATDLVFTLGILRLFDRCFTSQLKIFLTALAVIDDFIAIVMIALFYTKTIVWYYLFFVIFCILILFFLNRHKVGYITVYLFIGLIMWYCCYMSGLRATVSGVILGFSIPLYVGRYYSPLKSLEYALKPLVSYIILPLFAFANSSITLSDLSFSSIFNSITIGIVVGLFFGKQIGIFGAIFLLVKCKIVQLHKKVSMLHYYIISIMCGVGFTMSLFIGTLSFENNEVYLYNAKIGVMLGSALSCAYCSVITLLTKSFLLKRCCKTA